MKKGFRSDTNGVFIITCDNLGEYFAEFTKYRKSARESSNWTKGLDKTYSEGTVAFKEDFRNNRIVDFLLEDYGNFFGGRNGRLELELVVDQKSSEWLSRREKVNQTLKEIWKTGEMKNTYGLDLDWPVASQPDQNQLPNNNNNSRINDLERENSGLKEQLKKENDRKTIWMVISISMAFFLLILLFCWLKVKKLKKR